MTDTVQQVLNPQWARLDQVRSEVITAAPGVETALDDADRRMQSGRTWTGTGAAPAWAAELGGRRRLLATLLSTVIDEIEQQLKTMERMVDPQEAEAINTGRSVYRHKDGFGY